MSEKNQPNYALRRAGTVLALGAVVLGGGILTDKLMDRIAESKHTMMETEVFSDPHLKDHLSETLKKNNILPKDVAMHIISNLERNPTDVAKDMGAKDTQFVAELLSRQVGGAGNMQPGSPVFVPEDMLVKTLPGATNQ